MKARNGVLILLLSAGLIFLLHTGCETYESKQRKYPDTPHRGSIRVSADESFKPVLDEFVMIYEGNHPKTKINIDYKPEADCLKDMLNDSVRMVIVTRHTTEAEQDAIVDSLKIGPSCLTVARDGIAVIVNPEEEDSVLSMTEIRQILTGKFKKNLIPVFDGLKATSTVRFIIDSVLRGDSLTTKAMAARTSAAVVDYVSQNKGVIGFIGASWIGNPEDTAQVSFLKKVKVVAVESILFPGYYCKPLQAFINVKMYPMVRDLDYVLREPHKGLGTGFANFMSGEIGQLLFKRTYLAPALKDFGLRPIRITEKKY
ncbi:MAG: substrate-binding domain-containing protein [Chitinophagaceae bacterium]|nr:substrate-binding domain-containing protein [Chitinophagaceae bacterium]